MGAFEEEVTGEATGASDVDAGAFTGAIDGAFTGAVDGAFTGAAEGTGAV